jgi:hypothetical protein
MVDFEDSGVGDYLCYQPIEVPCDYPGIPSINWYLSAKKPGAANQANSERDSKKLQRLNSAQQYLKENNLEVDLANVVQELVKTRPKDPHGFVSSRMQSLSRTSPKAGDPDNYARPGSRGGDRPGSRGGQMLPPLPKKETAQVPSAMEAELPAKAAKGLPPIDRGELSQAGLKSVKSAPTLKAPEPPRSFQSNQKQVENYGSESGKLADALSDTNKSKPAVLPFARYYNEQFNSAEQPGDFARQLFPQSAKGSPSSQAQDSTSEMDRLREQAKKTLLNAARTESIDDAIARVKTRSETRPAVLPFATYYRNYCMQAGEPGDFARKLFPQQPRVASESAQPVAKESASVTSAALVSPQVAATPSVPASSPAQAGQKVDILPFATYYTAYYASSEPPGDFARRLFPSNVKASPQEPAMPAATASPSAAIPPATGPKVDVIPFAAYYTSSFRASEPPGDFARRLFPESAKARLLSEGARSAEALVETAKSSLVEAVSEEKFDGALAKLADARETYMAEAARPQVLPFAAYYSSNFYLAAPTTDLIRRLFPEAEKGKAAKRATIDAPDPSPSLDREQSAAPELDRQQSAATRAASTMVFPPSSPREMDDLDEMLASAAPGVSEFASLPYNQRPSATPALLPIRRYPAAAPELLVADPGIYANSQELVSAPSIWDNPEASQANDASGVMKEPVKPVDAPSAANDMASTRATWSAPNDFEPSSTQATWSSASPQPAAQTYAAPPVSPVSPSAEDANAQERIRQSPILREDTPEHRISPSQKRQISGQETVTQRLRVVVQRATGLRNADMVTLSDPYCVLEVKGTDRVSHKRFKTKVIDNDLYPVWNESYDFDYQEGDELSFSLWDKDWGKTDDFLGIVRLKPDMFLPDGFEGRLQIEESGKSWWQDVARLYLKVRPLT